MPGARLADAYPGLAGPTGRSRIRRSTRQRSTAATWSSSRCRRGSRFRGVVPEIARAGALVVDLGADFRLKDASLYPVWYGWEHTEPELLAAAIYGMPEFFRPELAGARLIASPGCYVTAASIALRPLVEAGVIETSGVVVDAASGTSGAGKEPSPAMHFATVNENFTAYGVLNHRHTPEIEQVIGAQVLFTPHLAPMTRGILATCYARPAAPTSTGAILDLYRDRYADEPFVEVSEAIPATRHTYGSNRIHLTARYDERTGTVLTISAIDNLTKGGSGQAIQAANVALNLPETMGLDSAPVLP